MDAVRHFEIYLFGNKFKVVTDHKALTHLFSSTVLNAKLWQWALYLQQFDMVFQYIQGRFNIVADCLSRQTWPSPVLDKSAPVLPISDVVVPVSGKMVAEEKDLVPASSVQTTSQDCTSISPGGDVGGVPPHTFPPT